MTRVIRRPTGQDRAGCVFRLWEASQFWHNRSLGRRPPKESSMFSNASILVTGGTGSFGKAFVGTLLDRYPEIRRLVVFSRDEPKQFEMSQIWPERDYKGLRYFLGDVRDGARLARAMEGVDYVVHAAALKQVVA